MLVGIVRGAKTMADAHVDMTMLLILATFDGKDTNARRNQLTPTSHGLHPTPKQLLLGAQSFSRHSRSDER
jgi:hypothetical protein